MSTESEKCLDCEQSFDESYLRTHFGYNVCNKCRDPKDKHTLITRTEAKSEYLLKDCDLDLREPPLKCIVRRNPNPLARNDMRLYLQIQIEERALLVWESEDNLIDEKEKREAKRKERQEKSYKKKLNQLRMSARSSLFEKKTAGHEHEYGNEKYNKDDDVFEKECTLCGHILSYEKM